MTIHPKDELADEQHQKKLDADIERRDDERIEKYAKECALWNDIMREAKKISDNTHLYDYGIPNYVFMQFISELQIKYHIKKREPENDF
jgi:hypothetical protein